MTAGGTPPQWVRLMAEQALENARACEREGRRLRGVARMMLAPPEGVSVEYAGGDEGRFVGLEPKL